MSWHGPPPAVQSESRNVLQSGDGRRNGNDVTVKSIATPSSRRADVPAPAARARAALAALVLWAVPALAQADPAAGARGARPDDAVTFTVSGGISLGVYEAGLTWGVVRYLQAARAREGPLLFRPSLATVTGASAGAVNAFLAAALWCERPEHRGGVDANLLLDTWLDLDLSEFLPRSAEKYSAGDGLLSAAPLERAGRAVGAAIFGSGARGRFAQDCRVPVGITVTPFEPRRRDVAGLTAATQRLVVPWRLEGGLDGKLTVRRQPLAKGQLADDVLDLVGIPGPGDATPFRADVVVQALLASTAVPMAFAPRRLCARAGEGGPAEACDLYVDGGVFDNAPLGLGVDLVERTARVTVLHPITSFLVDPERRRLRAPRAEPAADERPTTLARQLRLLGNLVTTARSAELARAARARGWNRTTERVVRESSRVAAEFAELFAATSSDAAPTPPGAANAQHEAPAAGRAAVGRALSACLERLATSAARGAADPCARHVLSLDVASAAPDGDELPPDEVVRLAERLVRFQRAAGERDEAAQGGVAVATRQRWLRETASVIASALFFLADEVRRVSASGLAEHELRRFRDAVLEPVNASRVTAVVTPRLLRDRLLDELARLVPAAPPSVADEARRAREKLAALPDGALFDADALEATAAAASEAMARGTWDAAALADAWRGVLRLLEARARVVELSARLEALRQDVADLADGSRPEHRLLVSSRFAPLAGSQLGGFAAFLDRPLRRYDYYAGVYEAVHLIGVGVCTNERPSSLEAAPVRLQRDPSEIDLTATDSQRCIGHVMRRVVEVLGIRESPQARHVLATLAGLEMAAWLGSSSRALLLRREPSWAWLDELAAPSREDPVLATLDALTAEKEACRPGDEEPLCPADLPFDRFLAALAAHGYRPASAGMALALREPEVWWADALQRLADRALAVERAASSAPGPLSDTPATALAAASLVARRAAARGPTPRLLLDPSTIPGPSAAGQPGWGWRRLAAHALPYRLSLDFAHGGFAAAWLEPVLHLTRSLSLQSTLEEIGYRHETGWTSAAGALVVAHALGLSLGAGPRAWLDWRGGSGVGVEARLAALQDRLAVGVGMRDPAGGPRGREWTLTVSVADLNGLVFWLSPP